MIQQLCLHFDSFVVNFNLKEDKILFFRSSINPLYCVFMQFVLHACFVSCFLFEHAMSKQ